MKNYVTNILLPVLFLLCFISPGKSQTLIMNEVSNGPAGNQEYVEFVVVSTTVTYDCGSTTPPCIDIRGWIFDDNSGYHGSSGVATGAVRFSQNALWSCVPVGTIILIYNNADRNPAIPADDLSLSDGNCRIIAPLNSTLFESNGTTPGASACSYPVSGWTSGGSWNNTLLANAGDCARIVNLAGCEVFSVCWASDNLNNLIYFTGSAAQKVYYFNGGNPSVQANWSSGSANPSPGLQTPGAPNNAANASYIAQFNNNCMPITPIHVTATSVNAGCTCNGSATATASGSIGGYTYVWYDATYNTIGQTAATATGLCGGMYHVIARSSIGCTDTATVTLTSTSTTTVSAAGAGICAGQSTSLTATPSATGGTYVWNPGAQTTQTITVSPASTTTYTVMYTLAGCSGTGTATVTVTPQPVITVNSPTICNGQTATLTATGATSYAWNTGATSNPLNVSPSATTTYTVTGTTAVCSSSSTATVTVNAVPVLAVNSETICAGLSTTLTATGGTTYLWNTGSAANPLSVSPTSTTSYTVTGTSAGCAATAVATVTVNPVPTITLNSATICAGDTTTLTASGAGTYVWDDGSMTNPLRVSPATTTVYTVAGTSSGCTGTATATVTVNPLPVISVNSDTICSGQTATLTASGAFTYVWSNGATINPVNVSPVANTTYTVTGTTAGCSNTATAMVTVNAVPVIAVNPETICAGQSATLTASGAAAYTWNTGATGGILTISPAATTSYIVTGTSAGCSITAVATVTVNAVPTVVVNSPTICAGQTADLLASGAANYVWTAGTTITGTSTATAAPASTATYTVTGSVPGCSNTAVSTVTVNAVPVVNVNSATVCPGSTVTLTATGAATYSWSNGAITDTINVVPLSVTSYTVVGMLAGCADSAISTVITHTVMPVNAGANDSICFGGNIGLTVSPNGVGYSYTWLPAASLSNNAIYNPVASPAATTNYVVTVTDTNGCIKNDSIIIYVDPQLTLATSSTPVLCHGGNNGQMSVSVLGGSGMYAYLWSNGATTATAQDSAGTYPVLVTDSWGCRTIDTATIAQPAALTATATPLNVTCFGACNGTATASGNGGTSGAAGYTYLWSTSPVQATATATGLCAGVYNCTIKDDNNCTAITTVTITEPTVVVIDSMADVRICNNATVPLNAAASGGSGMYTYNWMPVTGLSTATISNPVANPAVTTVYTVHVTDVNGCTAARAVTVNVNPPLNIVTGNGASICLGASAVISASATSGTGSGYTYSWQPVTGLDVPISASPNATPAVTTTYTVTVTDLCASTATATETVVVLPLPTPVVTSDLQAGCVPLCVQFTDTTGIAAGSIGSWSWDFGDGGMDDVQSATHCYMHDGAFAVALTITGINGCSNTVTHTNYIHAYPLPAVAFTSNVQEASIFSPEINFVNETSGAAAWSWNFGDLSTSSQLDPEHTYANPGTYPVWLVTASDKGCVDSVEHDVVITGAYTFFVPNAFTPDGDLMNNVFQPKGMGWDPDRYQLMVFDRWGNVCFQTTDVNKGWDGKVKSGAEVAQMDVYVWKVVLWDVLGNKHSYMGTVTIVK